MPQGGVVLLKRILTSVIGIPLLVFFLIFGGWPLKAALFVLTIIGMSEFYPAVSGKHLPIHFVGYFFAGVYYLCLDSLYNTNVFMIILITFMLALAIFTVALYGKTSVTDAYVTFFGFFYAAVLLSTIYLTSVRVNGTLFVGIAFIAAWGSDTGAFFAGKLFGKHKLAPNLSPNKTVEGAVGGVLLAAILTTVWGIFIFETRNPDINLLILKYTAIGVICAVFSQLGDLFASAVKRFTGIKDFGRLLPGHGGVIDRFDSVLFTAPALYILLLIIVR